MSQFIFHAILTKIHVFEVARGLEIGEKRLKLPHQCKLTAVAILHGIVLMSVFLCLSDF